jgi:hypothetical protein
MLRAQPGVVSPSGFVVSTDGRDRWGLAVAGLIGYIPSFDQMVEDVWEYFASVRERYPPGLKTFLLGESMGGEEHLPCLPSLRLPFLYPAEGEGLPWYGMWRKVVPMPVPSVWRGPVFQVRWRSS